MSPPRTRRAPGRTPGARSSQALTKATDEAKGTRATSQVNLADVVPIRGRRSGSLNAAVLEVLVAHGYQRRTS